MTKESEFGIYSGGIHFINVQGKCNNKVNIDEINRVKEVVRGLKENGFENIGVITPFTNQKNRLKNELGSEITILPPRYFSIVFSRDSIALF